MGRDGDMMECDEGWEEDLVECDKGRERGLVECDEWLDVTGRVFGGVRSGLGVVIIYNHSFIGEIDII